MSSDDAFVRNVETYMRTMIARSAAAAPALRLLDAGGKRLRARLVWWSANATAQCSLDSEDPALVRAAAAIELAHLGSLIHDDMVDGAETRRGVPTVHRACGVRVATDAGASVAHLASQLAASLGARARRAVRRALLATCRGQVRELAVPFVRVSPRRRLAIMQEKTGAFFELAASLGAIVVGADVPSYAAVRRFARRFGVAFQIADDVLDLAGDPAELGRANGADLREGVVTLPVLLAHDPDQRLARSLARVQTASDAGAVDACRALIVGGGGTAAASAVARWWLERAIAAAEDLHDGHARGQLIELARVSVARGLRTSAVASPAAIPSKALAVRTETPFIDSHAHAPRCHPLPRRLNDILEWFHAGVSAMVVARMQEPAIAAGYGQHRRLLDRGRRWSADAAIAAEAIALAHALAEPSPLRDDTVRTLALVDALHCAAISLLAQLPSPAEHERLAARAQAVLELSAREPQPRIRTPRPARSAIVTLQHSA